MILLYHCLALPFFSLSLFFFFGNLSVCSVHPLFIFTIEINKGHALRIISNVHAKLLSFFIFS